MSHPSKSTLLGLALVLVASTAALADHHGGYLELIPNQSQEVHLSDLLSGQIPGLSIGDKLFDNFTYSSTGDMPKADRVVITGITDSDGNLGIRIQGAFADFPDIGQQLSSDAGITFEVAINPEYVRKGWIITDAHLFGSGANLSGAGSFISVDESFTDNEPMTDETMQVYASSIGQGGQQFEDWVYFDHGYTKLKVQKDILARAGQESIGPARMTIIEQTFSQEIIPEPTTLGLIGLALCGLGLRRRQE